MESLSDTNTVIDDGVPHLIRYGLRRIDTDGVTGMNTCAFDMLHDSRNIHMFTIADRINFQLLTDNVFIDQNRCIVADFLNCRSHINTQIIIIVHDFHCTSAEDIGWTHQHRIPDAVRNVYGFLYLHRCFSLRLRDIQRVQQCFKCMTVFGTVNVLKRGSQNLHTAFHQLICQIDCRLTAKLNNHAQWLFQIHNVHNILDRQRFKIQLVGNREICRYRFRIVVDNDCLIAALPQRHDTVYSRIVEFHTLSDTNRSGAENNDFLTVCSEGFRFLFIGGIEIRCRTFKFRCTGIHHFIYRYDAVFLPQLIDGALLHSPLAGDIGIRKAIFLQRTEYGKILWMCHHFFFQRNDIRKFIQEEHIDSRNFMNTCQGFPAANQLGDAKHAQIVLDRNLLPQLLCGTGIDFLMIDVITFHFQRAYCLQKAFFKIATDGHDLTGSLHLCSQTAVGTLKFIKREACQLCHNVIQ